MVHSAYDSYELLTDIPSKIHVMESYGSKLLVGCSDYSLRIYASESSSSSSIPDRSHPPSDRLAQTLELKREPYFLEKTVNGFSKRPMVAMEVLVSRELLLSLSASIAFHRLPSLEVFARHRRFPDLRGGRRTAFEYNFVSARDCNGERRRGKGGDEIAAEYKNVSVERR